MHLSRGQKHNYQLVMNIIYTRILLIAIWVWVITIQYKVFALLGCYAVYMNTCCIKTQKDKNLIYAMAEAWHLAQFNTTPTLH
jgi:predicted tellurium resistance membrane protein TerC